uniref:Uncharacterized protein n=1 Tax=Sphaerodactylus townsendi TaxID=933632 RepID=A0ACB8FJ09_9SAUR
MHIFLTLLNLPLKTSILHFVQSMSLHRHALHALSMYFHSNLYCIQGPKMWACSLGKYLGIFMLLWVFLRGGGRGNHEVLYGIGEDGCGMGTGGRSCGIGESACSPGRKGDFPPALLLSPSHGKAGRMAGTEGTEFPPMGMHDSVLNTDW